MLPYAMAVPTTFLVQHPRHCIAPASPDLIYSSSVKPPRHLFMDCQSSTGTSCGLLTKIGSGNRTLPNPADKCFPMQSQFKIHVQASPYSEADKRRLLKHTDNYVFMCEYFDSKDPELSGDIKKSSSLVDHHDTSLVHKSGGT